MLKYFNFTVDSNEWLHMARMYEENKIPLSYPIFLSKVLLFKAHSKQTLSSLEQGQLYANSLMLTMKQVTCLKVLQ